MKITGTRSWLCFDFENGYRIKATGELLSNYRFAVDTSSLRNWEPPHENETITNEQIKDIITSVDKMTTEAIEANKFILKIIFD